MGKAKALIRITEAKEKYPMIEDNPELVKSVIGAINSGKVESLKINSDFIDDHEICVNITVTLKGGKSIKYSDWWLSREGYKLYVRAEVDPIYLKTLIVRLKGFLNQ